MKTIRPLILGFLLISASAAAQTTVTATWPFDRGTDNPSSAQIDNDTAFTLSNFVLGSHLTCTGIQSPNTESVSYSKIQPDAQMGSATPGYELSFMLKPSRGLQFTPTRISFKASRFGTDGGFLVLTRATGEGAEETIAQDLKPNRNNVDPFFSVYDYALEGLPASEDAFVFKIYIHSLGNNKQIGFYNIAITGRITGELIEVNKYTLNTAVSPAAAGSITLSPQGNSFDEGSEITLTANKAFGYKFNHWEDGQGTVLSQENPYVHTITADTNLIAVFDKLNTYSLMLAVEGGANDYMLSVSPAGTLVNDTLRYEENTQVSLKASGNKILTFNNWSSGETNSELLLDMTRDYELTAYYSAVDFIVGWDFYRPGNSGRPADFASEGNSTSILILRNAEGNATGWLDKSQQAAGGYEGRPSAVNWKALADKYYYQLSFDATNFTDIKVASALLFNYNAYSKIKLEYSLDNENFTTVDTIHMLSNKVWYDTEFSLPSDADHAPKVYVRWLPDYTSPVLGTTSNNDGTSITDIYITGTGLIYDDGKAPVFLGSVPADQSTGASATGKIVLSFDEKIKLSDTLYATLDDQPLEGLVSGKTLSFAYRGLEYAREYTFVLPANAVSDLTDNFLDSVITIRFTTMERPVVAKKLFDAVVSNTGELLAALEAAHASQTGERFRILLKNGEYDLGSGITTITAHKVSLIGQSREGVLVYNTSINEGISITSTIFLSGATGFYAQDITFQNKYPYMNTTGRAVVLRDTGTKNIFKNISLLSFQDTYYSGNSGRMYFEDCQINGVVDFICGGSDIFFNRCLLALEKRSGNCITAPSGNGDWGYVFSDCTIDGVDDEARAVVNGTYSLGRPWQGAPRAVYLNTTMKVVPTAAGWTNMSETVLPALFAEFNSVNANGDPVDLSNRMTTFTAGTVSYNPVLTPEQAAQFTIDNVLGGSDAWQPVLATEQAGAPVLTLDAGHLVWDSSDYVLCYVVCRDGEIVDVTTSCTYEIPDSTGAAEFVVHAVNEHGGLSEASNPVQNSGLQSVHSTPEFYASGKTLVLKGVTESVQVTLYDLTGLPVKTLATDSDLELTMKPGAYVLRLQGLRYDKRAVVVFR